MRILPAIALLTRPLTIFPLLESEAKTLLQCLVATLALIIGRLNKEINTILAKPKTKAALQKMAMTPMVMTPGKLRSFVSSEITRWGKYIEFAGIPKNKCPRKTLQ